MAHSQPKGVLIQMLPEVSKDTFTHSTLNPGLMYVVIFAFNVGSLRKPIYRHV